MMARRSANHYCTTIPLAVRRIRIIPSSLWIVTSLFLGRGSYAYISSHTPSRRFFSLYGSTPNDLERLRVLDLKEQLREAGLKLSGRKSELIERLQLHYNRNDTTMPKRKSPRTKAPKEEEEGKEDDVKATEEEPELTPKKKKKKASDHQRQTERTEIPKLWNGSSDSYTFKIASWNVAGLRALMRNHPDALPDLVQKHDLDVLCLQEIKLQESHVDDPKLKIGGILLHEEGYEGHYSCSTTKKGYSGTAVFVKKRSSTNGEKTKKQTSLSSFFTKADKKDKSKKEDENDTNNDTKDSRNINNIDINNLIPTNVSFGIGKKKHDGEGRSITVEFPLFTMTNLYVPNSGQKLERLLYRTKEWDVDLLEYMQSKETPDKPIIWLGDLNVAHTAQETWNEGAKHLVKSAGTTPEERASFTEQLSSTGYIDAFKQLHPDALGHYTYWSQRAGNRCPNKGLRLDYFVCSPSLFEGDRNIVVRDCYMLPEQLGSDHCPIVLELEIKK